MRLVSGSSRREGIALLVTLLGILVLEVIVAGTFHVATQQVRTARAGAWVLRLQLAAQAAASTALEAWDPDSVASLSLDDRRTRVYPATADGIQTRTTLHRVDSALYLVEADALTARGGHARVGIIVRSADPGDYLADVGAAVAVGGDVAATGGLLSGTSLEACGDSAAVGALPALLLRDSAALEENRVVDGFVTRAPEVAWDRRAAGVDLGALAAELSPGSLELEPLESGGECVTSDPGNWGEPRIAAHPCARHFPVIRVAGDLRLEGGAGQGVLIVDGDAVFAPGVEYHGLLFVAGSLTLQAGAFVSGAVRVGRDLVVQGARIRFEPCRVLRAARHGHGTRGPFRPSGHWWIPY